MKVSIIIPVFNTEKYIAQCLFSAINQTLKEIEIIVINDASTDNSLSIINSFRDNDSRIKLIDLEINKGNGYGRNIAIQQAKGEYILFLDSDDWLENIAAETVYKKAITNKYPIVLLGYTQHMQFLKKNHKRTKVFLPKLDEDDTSYFRYFLLARKGVQAMPWTYLFSRDFILDNKIQFSEGIYFEDLNFVAKALHYASKIGVIAETPLYNYRIRKNSIVQSTSKKKIDDNFTAHLLLKEFMRELKVYDKYTDEYMVRMLTFCVYINFIDYIQMPKTKIDMELSDFMEKIRLSSLFSISNIMRIKSITTSFDKDESETKKFYHIAYSSLSVFRNRVGYFVYTFIFTRLITFKRLLG